MAHLTADTMTSGPAPAIHAGPNVQISRFSMGGTSSGSLTVAVTPLPAGAEVIRCTLMQSNTIGTGGELVSVYATIGGTRAQTYIGSAASGLLVAANNASAGADEWSARRLTASANVIFSLTNAVGTGTGSCDFTVVLEYLTRSRGD